MKLNLNGLRRSVLCAGLTIAALLAACGGGKQSEPFHATRVLAFGDETSVINLDGSKYTVNGVTAGTTTLDCTINPIWVQKVAAVYGLVFPQCNPAAVVSPTSLIAATNGAKAADLVLQVDQQVLNGGFVANDLATVLVGANDVVAQFQQYPAVSEAQLIVNVRASAAITAFQVKRLADLGAKVLISTIPDMGLAPVAGGRGTESAGVLSRLSTAYNVALRTAGVNNFPYISDGLRVGLVLLNEEYLKGSADAADAASSGAAFVNAKDAACAIALPKCSVQTLVSSGASGTTWLWADSQHLSAGAQAGLGALATSRLSIVPF